MSISKERVVSVAKNNILLIFAVLLMLVPVIMAYAFVIPVKSGLFFWTEVTSDYRIRPDGPSMFCAILLYTATIIRGDLSIFKSPVKVVLMILNLLFIASFTKTMINTNEWKVGPFGVLTLPITNLSVFIFCVALSWLGMKTLAGFSWIILFLAAVGELTAISDAAGPLGAFYVLFAFLSLGMQMAGGYISFNGEQLKSDFFSASSIVKSDVNQSIETTKGAVNNAIGVAKMVTGVPNIPNMQSEPKQIVDNE